MYDGCVCVCVCVCVEGNCRKELRSLHSRRFLVCSGSRNKTPRTGWLEWQTFISDSSGDQKSQIKVWASLVPGWLEDSHLVIVISCGLSSVNTLRKHSRVSFYCIALFYFRHRSWLYLASFFLWLCLVFVAACRLSLVATSGATLHCSVQASHCSGFSCGKAKALEHVGSVVVAHRFSWPKVCGIFLD